MAFNVAELMATFRVQGTQAAVSGINQVRTGFGEAGDAASRASGQIDRTQAAFTGAGRAATVASSGTAKFRAAQLSAVAATERYNALLADEDASLARLASAEASVIRANDRVATSQAAAAASTGRAVTAFGSAKAKVGGFAESMAKLGLGLAGFEAVIKGIELIKAGAQFQQTMLLIQTNAGATAGDVKKLSSAVLGLAGQVAASPEDLANALYHIAQNSHGLLTTAQMMDALKIGAEGAKIGMADVEETTNALTFALASGIPGVNDMNKAMGFLLATVGTGDMRMADLNDALGTGILSVAKQFGASLQDVSAVLATLGDNGIRGATAAQGLRQALMGMAKPAKEGADELASVGLSMTDLKDDMEQHGLVHAMNDLNQHMQSAGITGSKVGGFITNAFGRKAGSSIAVLMGEIDRLNTKFGEIGAAGGQFQSKWDATTHTVAFAFQRLGAEAQSAGIRIFEALGPVVGTVGGWFASVLPKAFDAARTALSPIASLFQLLGRAVGPVASAFGTVGSTLRPLVPILEGVGGATAAMWVAFKGYQIARAAAIAVKAAYDKMILSAAKANIAVSMGAQKLAFAFGVSSVQIEADSKAQASEAANNAAAHERAGARIAAAYADQVAASSAATDAQVANAEELSAAQNLAAEEATIAAGETEAAAEEAALAVNAAGDSAKIGWASIGGPLALAAIGVATLVAMFHHSTTASKEAADAAKAYTDALKSGNTSDVFGAIVKQLSDNHLPQLLDSLNKELGKTAFTGAQFATAIQNGGKPLDDLKNRLNAIIEAGHRETLDRFGREVSYLTPAAKDASKALKELETQTGALSKAQKQDLENLKSFGQAAVPIQNVAESTHLASKTAQTYAEMLGIQVDKSGNALGSAKDVDAAVQDVATAFQDATLSGNDFLGALQTFSKDGDTAASRAALIGATLKAANGDALAFAGAINGAAVANSQLVTDLANSAKSVGKSGESVHAFIGSIVDLKTGTIDFSNAAAAPLINDLSSIQNAAVKAAGAMYQHEKATRGSTQAADDAYNEYVGQTRGALVDQAKQLGLTKDQAQKLADKYFGMPKEVKTLIEQEGANPVLDVLNRIGKLLAKLTGQTWTPVLGANTEDGDKKIQAYQQKINDIKQGKIPDLTANSAAGKAVIDMYQKDINAVKQGRPVPVTANTVEGKAKVQEYQDDINAIKQGKIPGLKANTAAGRAAVQALQLNIDAVHQGKPPPIKVDDSAALYQIGVIKSELEGLSGYTVTSYLNVVSNLAAGRATHTGGLAHSATGNPDFPGGLSVVGEEGPEIVALPPHTRIYDNRTSERIMAAAPPDAKVYVPITVNPAPSMDESALAMATARRFQALGAV